MLLQSKAQKIINAKYKPQYLYQSGYTDRVYGLSAKNNGTELALVHTDGSIKATYFVDAAIDDVQLDANDPFNLLLFNRATQSIILLDNRLSEKANWSLQAQLDDFFVAVLKRRNNEFWMVNDQQELLRVNQQDFSVISRSTLTIEPNDTIFQWIENEQLIWLETKKGFYGFDPFGTAIKHKSIQHHKPSSINKNKALVPLSSQSIEIINLQTISLQQELKQLPLKCNHFTVSGKNLILSTTQGLMLLPTD